jgi:hypothetical protein
MNDAEKMSEHAMQVSKKISGQDQQETLAIMNILALTYKEQGRWDKAEKLLVEVMETCKMKLGADHPHNLTSIGNLASTYWNQDR